MARDNSRSYSDHSHRICRKPIAQRQSHIASQLYPVTKIRKNLDRQANTFLKKWGQTDCN